MARSLEELAAELDADPEFHKASQAEQDAVFAELAKGIPQAMRPPAPAPPSSEFLPFAGTSVEAIGRSGASYLGNMAQGIAHPIQTAKGLMNMAAGGVEKLIPGQQPQEPYADAVGEFVKQRYGSFDALRETWKRDPVGVVADASMLLTGGGGAIAKIGTVQGIPRAVRLGQLAAKAGEVMDPLTITLHAAQRPAKAMSQGMKRTAGSAINNLIKPTNRQFAFGRNPGAAVAAEGIVAGSLDELALKIGQRKQQLGQQIGAALDAPVIAGQAINVTSALDPITTALQAAQKTPRTNAAVIQRLENLRDDLLGVVVNPDGTTTVTRDLSSMRPRQAFELKQMIGDLTKWTENISDDSLVNGALKKVYATIRSRIERVAPGIKPINERYANLLEAERATRSQAHASMRKSPFGLYDVVAGSAGGMHGGIEGATIGILLSQGAKAALNSPYIRSQLASWMSRATPTEINAFFNRIPGLKTEAMRVGLLAGTGEQRINDLQSDRQVQ